MRQYVHNGQVYRLANGLTQFQLDMQIHLTNWKWDNLKTRDCGLYKGQPYDVILPESMKAELQPIYRPILARLQEHQRRLPFKLHKYVGHMASSQVACINLFIPLLVHPEEAAQVLKQGADAINGRFHEAAWRSGQVLLFHVRPHRQRRSESSCSAGLGGLVQGVVSCRPWQSGGPSIMNTREERHPCLPRA
jgi:hypothetical protein